MHKPSLNRIHRDLLKQIEKENVILFLGSGSTKECRRPDEKLGGEIRGVDGKELAKEIVTDLNHGNQLNFEVSLMEACEYYISVDPFTQTGWENLIRSRLKGLQPTIGHHLATTFPWRAIVTTNYNKEKLIMSNSHNEMSDEFMLAEFNAIQSHVIKFEEAKSNRVNFFLIVVAAAAAGVSGLIGNSNFQAAVNLIIAFASFGLLILGIAVLNQLIRYSEAIVGLYRRAGRIRRYFVDSDAGIKPYLAFEASDDRPLMNIGSAYLEFRGGDVILLTLNSTFFAIFTFVLISTSFSLSDWFASPLAMGSGLMAWFGQKIRIRARLRKIEARMQKSIVFPHVTSQDEKAQEKALELFK
jgi:hypothetical protein